MPSRLEASSNLEKKFVKMSLSRTKTKSQMMALFLPEYRNNSKDHKKVVKKSNKLIINLYILILPNFNYHLLYIVIFLYLLKYQQKHYIFQRTSNIK